MARLGGLVSGRTAIRTVQVNVPPPPTPWSEVSGDDRDAAYYFFPIGTSDSIPVGVSKFPDKDPFKVNAKLIWFSVDVPSGVSCEVLRDGSSWFFTSGDLVGGMPLTDGKGRGGVTFGSLQVIFNNTLSLPTVVRADLLFL
jgi:hypothetical protein